MSEQYKGVVVHVHHKCGLPLSIKYPESKKKIDLGHCMCHGQTQFDYERKERTVEEAIEIGVDNFVDTAALYLDQERDEAYRYMELCERYKGVLIARWLKRRGLPY